MFIILSKLLPLFIYPLGLVCILLVILLFLGNTPRRTRVLLLVALAILWLSSINWTAATLVRSLETRYLPSQELPPLEVAVVLSGGTHPQLTPRPLVEVNEGGDRILYAAWLYQQGKVEKLLLTGGSIEFLNPGMGSAAEDMVDLFSMLGVPEEALWLETEAQNTYENAVFSAEMLEEAGIERVYLVTSAMHMPRSVAMFAQQGVEVIPAPTDFAMPDAEWDYLFNANLASQFFNLLPQSSNLFMTTKALKEYIGLMVYAFLGSSSAIPLA